MIKDNLNFTEIGKFIGDTNVLTAMTIDLEETALKEVKATSTEAGLDNTPANECTEDAEQEKLWHCKWNEVEVQPTESISVAILATDQKGNKASKTISKLLTKDSSAPQIDFFGTERQFEDKNFVRDGSQRILLRVREQGAGIDEDGIRANLLALGKGTSEPPTSCEQTETTFNCFWETSQSGLSGTLRVGLSKFQDKVGNQGTTPEIELVADNNGPLVEKVAVFGLSDVGEKDYFQSNDVLKVKLKVVETYGLLILLNLNGLVLDVETKFPESELTSGLGPGWMAFTNDDCIQEEGKWNCDLETLPIKSGPDSSAQLEIRVRDTAGNDAQEWPETARNAKSFQRRNDGSAEYKFDLLGLSEENAPNFWEVASGYPKVLIPFVDLDTVDLTAARMPVEVKLKTAHANARVLKVELAGCEGIVPSETKNVTMTAPALSRTLMYGGTTTESGKNSKPIIVLEFAPFNGKEHFGITQTAGEEKFVPREAKYQCQLRIFTQLDKVAIRHPELQEVDVTVQFAFSQLGALDENLKARVDEIKNEALFVIPDKLKSLTTVLEWVRFLLSIANIIRDVNILINIVNAGGDSWRAAIITTPIAQSICAGAQKTKTPLWGFLEYIQVPLEVLTCNPDPSNLGWYGKYQKGVLLNYNLFSGRGLAGFPAQSLYENLYTSAIGLCLPGIIYNLEKYRQVRCREIICLQREVPQGIATVSACEELGSQLKCEYVLGPLLQLTPLNILQEVVEWIKSYFESPIGLIRVGLMAGCTLSCPVSNAGTVTCDIVAFVIKAGDIVDTAYGAFQSHPQVTSNPYCSQIE